jgi:hypothetical protein
LAFIIKFGIFLGGDIFPFGNPRHTEASLWRWGWVLTKKRWEPQGIRSGAFVGVSTTVSVDDPMFYSGWGLRWGLMRFHHGDWFDHMWPCGHSKDRLMMFDFFWWWLILGKQMALHIEFMWFCWNFAIFASTRNG